MSENPKHSTGFHVPLEVVSQTLYGLYVDNVTGNLMLEISDHTDDDVLIQTESGQATKENYEEWTWASAALEFSLSVRGNLQVKVL